MLRTMLMGTLPDELENETNEKPHLTDYQKIIDWCRVRIEQKRQKMLSDHARKGIGHPKINMVHGNGIGESAEQATESPKAPDPAGSNVMAPHLVSELIAALKQGNRTPGRQTDKGSRGSRSPRSQSPGSKKSFMWDNKKCWHCGQEHRRETCKDWLAIMKAHNGSAARDQWKPPPGYVSAKAKAYAKWKEANGKPTKKVNMLRDDDANETDDDSSNEEGFRLCCSVKSNRSKGPRIAPPPAPLITKNSFEAFDDNDIDGDGNAALGDRAHKDTVGKRSQSETKKVRMITNQQELKKFMAANPNVAQLPVERKKLNKVMKLVSRSVELEEGETLVLMDSGSALNVAKIKTHFKPYANCVVPSSGSKSVETATTASGKQLNNLGKCTVHGTVDGQTIAIPFQDMDV